VVRQIEDLLSIPGPSGAGKKALAAHA